MQRCETRSPKERGKRRNLPLPKLGVTKKEAKLPKEKEFEPVLIGFFCRWCTSAAADLAGTTRLQYPPNIRPVQVMCSSAVDPVYIIRALLSGADGVIVGGCPPGDCHYTVGNFRARRRLAMLKTVLKSLGLDDGRVWVRWLSAAEGTKFAETMKEFTEHIRKKGPSQFKNRWLV